MNPCPCGYMGTLNHYCTCTPKQIISYQNRLSGPIRERFDLFLTLTSVNLQEYKQSQQESSRLVQLRVKEARERQYQRYGAEICNGIINYQLLINKSPGLESHLPLIQKLSSTKHWSNRTHVKIIRLARTIADMNHAHLVKEEHIQEAVKLYGRQTSEKHAINQPT